MTCVCLRVPHLGAPDCAAGVPVQRPELRPSRMAHPCVKLAYSAAEMAGRAGPLSLVTRISVSSARSIGERGLRSLCDSASVRRSGRGLM